MSVGDVCIRGSGRGPSALLADKALVQARLYAGYLRELNLDVTTVSTGRAALEVLARSRPKVVVLDLDLPDVDALQILARINNEEDPSATVAISLDASMTRAVSAMRCGAYDYLVKPFDAQRLVAAVRNALLSKSSKNIIRARRKPLVNDGLIGSSPPMQALKHVIETAAASRATVFITGESGTGKEVIAQLVHRTSGRAGKPFVAINCSALPKDLVEFEIFGHVKGAFTGATSDRSGAAIQADGGTLFLDEIAEMDIDLQAKLLRFLQDGTIRRVGASTVENVDVRIICATNRDPLNEVRAGRFREDLYYRLHVIPIRLPALRDRGDDAIEIARALVVQFAEEEGKSFKCLAPCTEAAIASYSWPGNVRQLQNVLRSAVVLNDGEELTASMLPEIASPWPRTPPSAPLSATEAKQALSDGTSSGAEPVGVNGIKSLALLEQEAIEAAIRICDNNIARAAAALEISPSTIYRKRQGWNIELQPDCGY